jgi:glyoxylase-like metal-dependent hydrolase (beta-lactamase superfamily II)
LEGSGRQAELSSRGIFVAFRSQGRLQIEAAPTAIAWACDADRNFGVAILSSAAKTPPFSRDMDFKYGALETVAPGLRRIVCRNPGPMTFKGTNLYVIGEGQVAVVDPGPKTEDQLDLLFEALGGETITHILITHCHSDHTGAAAALRKRTGAVVCGMPRPPGDPASKKKGRSKPGFVTPVKFDIALSHGSRIGGAGWEAEAVHTPGHAPDHLCFALAGQNILLSGDHVMGWNTSVIAPPEGHMGSYMSALEKLLKRKEAIYFPGHGGPVLEPQRFIKALIFHRRWRESEIMECLRDGLATIGEIVPRIYKGIEPSLLSAAGMAVFAQLEYLAEKGAIVMRKPGAMVMEQEFALA